jgi:hypothetical protein
VAIRYITDLDSLKEGFTWIQPINAPVIINRLLFIDRAHCTRCGTGDLAKFDNDKLIIYGRDSPGIRVNGTIISVEAFAEKLVRDTGIADYVIQFDRGNTIYNRPQISLTFNVADQHIVEPYLTKNQVEAQTVSYQETLATAGGIKYVG